MLTTQQFLENIAAYLAKADLSESAFGRAAVGDPNFIGDCKRGREPSLRLVRRVSEYIESNPPPATIDAPSIQPSQQDGI